MKIKLLCFSQHGLRKCGCLTQFFPIISVLLLRGINADLVEVTKSIHFVVVVVVGFYAYCTNTFSGGLP